VAIFCWSRLIENDEGNVCFDLADFSRTRDYDDWPCVLEYVRQKIWRIGKLEDEKCASSTQGRQA